MDLSKDDDKSLGVRGTSVALFCCFLFAGDTFAIEAAHTEGIAHFIMGLLRYAPALAVSGVWIRASRHRLELKWDALPSVAVLGFVLFFQSFLLFVGTGRTNAVHASILFGLQPFVTTVVATLCFRERALTGSQYVGMAVAFAGVLVLFLDKMDGQWLFGDLLVILSAVVLGVKLPWIKKIMGGGLHYSRYVFWEALFTIPWFIMASWLAREPIHDLTGTLRVAWPSLVYQSFLVAGMSFLLWGRLLELHPTSNLSVYLYTMPLFSVAIGWRLGKLDSSNLYLIVMSSILIATGLYLVNRRQRQRLNKMSSETP